jgi:uncharacterized delta-60 repeat protein
MNFITRDKRLKCYSRLSQTILAAFVSVLCVVTMSLPVHADANGILDKQFGNQGIVYPGGGYPSIVALQSDSKIVVAGPGVVERYNTDGSLDAAFGINGTAGLPSGATAVSIAVQADDKIVMSLDGEVFTLVRYTAEGVLDTTFGSGGIVTVQVGSASSGISDIKIQPDGKIVAGGAIWGDIDAFALARFNSDGSLDTGFALEGITTIDILEFGGQYTGFGNDGTTILDILENGNEVIRGVALAADGKIVAAGRVNTGTANTASDFTTVRYNADGTLDLGFGNNGIVIHPIGPGNTRDECMGVVITPDNKIVLGGYSGNLNPDFALTRYTSNGFLDTAFGNNGTIFTDFDNQEQEDFAMAIGIQSDGKILLTGNVNVEVHEPGGPVQRFVVGLVRYTTDGQLDATFGKGGKVTSPNVGPDNYTYARDLAIQQDGKILVSGHVLMRFK